MKLDFKECDDSTKAKADLSKHHFLFFSLYNQIPLTPKILLLLIKKDILNSWQRF